MCLSGACTFAATSACDWSTGTHVSQLSQSQAEVAAIVHMPLKQQPLWEAMLQGTALCTCLVILDSERAKTFLNIDVKIWKLL